MILLLKDVELERGEPNYAPCTLSLSLSLSYTRPQLHMHVHSHTPMPSNTCCECTDKHSSFNKTQISHMTVLVFTIKESLTKPPSKLTTSLCCVTKVLEPSNVETEKHMLCFKVLSMKVTN